MNRCEKFCLPMRSPDKHTNLVIEFTNRGDIRKTYSIPLCMDCTDKLDRAIAGFFEKRGD